MLLLATSEFRGALTVVSVVASVLYVVEFVARYAFVLRTRRWSKPGVRFWTGGRLIVFAGLAVPLASFFVPRGAAIGLVSTVFVVALGNEYRTWRSDRGSLTSAEATTSIDSPRIEPSLVYKMDGELVLRVLNTGPTLHDVRINLLAPKRHRVREFIYRKSPEGGIAATGTTDETPHELAGCPIALRWMETGLVLHGGHTTNEFPFFVPRHDGDPIELRVGADELGRWQGWTFTTPGRAVGSSSYTSPFTRWLMTVALWQEP